MVQSGQPPGESSDVITSSIFGAVGIGHGLQIDQAIERRTSSEFRADRSIIDLRVGRRPLSL